MEYFILNKNLKIPSLGYNHLLNNNNSELKFNKKYNLISTNDLIIYLDFCNELSNQKPKNNLFIAPFINNLEQFNNINYNPQFIIINNFNQNIINYCNQNNIYPILFFNYDNLISNNQNSFFKNNKFLNKELLIKILIEKGIIVILNQNIPNLKFDIFFGDLVDN